MCVCVLEFVGVYLQNEQSAEPQIYIYIKITTTQEVVDHKEYILISILHTYMFIRIELCVRVAAKAKVCALGIIVYEIHF